MQGETRDVQSTPQTSPLSSNPLSREEFLRLRLTTITFFMLTVIWARGDLWIYPCNAGMRCGVNPLLLRVSFSRVLSPLSPYRALHARFDSLTLRRASQNSKSEDRRRRARGQQHGVGARPRPPKGRTWARRKLPLFKRACERRLRAIRARR